MPRDFDPRTTVVSDDLVAANLADRYPRPRAVEGVRHWVVEASLPLTFAPAGDARLESELLFGEPFTVYDEADGWAWGQSDHDDYVGYVPAAGLTNDLAWPVHVVAVAASHLYPAPDLKRRPCDRFSLGSLVSVLGEQNGFAEIDGGGWLFARHLVPADDFEPNYIATARRFLGVPYLWGGRSSAGLDCSALVQLALQRAGIAAPRDSDMQAVELGEPLPPPFDPAVWQRGDLVFFPGHAGIVTEGGRFLHANARWMAVVEEPLADVLARAAAAGAGVSAVRRLALQ